MVYTQKFFICYTVNQRPETSDTVPTVVLAQLWVVGHREADYLAAEETVMAGAVMVGAVMAAETAQVAVETASVVAAMAVVMAAVVGVGTVFDARTSSP